MREHEINKLNNFICGWYLDDTTICDKLIEYHNTVPTTDGVMYSKGEQVVDKSRKDSTDCYLSDPDLWNEYCILNLQKVTNLYREKYPLCDKTSPWRINETVNIQKYKPNGAYHAWHSERTSSIHPVVNRHLVFMTYLNDVTDAGETEFFHQNIKVKPEKGLTLIWGTDWTFTHRGIPSPTQEKYIVTGWYNFVT